MDDSTAPVWTLRDQEMGSPGFSFFTRNSIGSKDVSTDPLADDFSLCHFLIAVDYCYFHMNIL